jgi:MFS family permease
MGIYLLIFMGGTPIGSPLIGWFAEHVGIRWTVMGCGLIVLAASTAIYIALRRGKGPEPVTESMPVIPETTS